MKISNSKDSYRLIGRVASSELESFWILGLDKRLKLKDYQCLAKEPPFNSPAPVNQVIQFILNCRAQNFILIHYHPCRELFPSDQDIRDTEIFKTIGEFLSIPLIDHIIVTKDSYRSFLDEGWMA